MIPLAHVLVLSGILFSLSVAGIFINRKNVIILLMCIELMLLAVNMNFIAFSHFLGDVHGQVFVFFVDAVSISTDTSDIALAHKLKMTRKEQIAKLVDCVSDAKSHGVYVCFNAGDATRTSIDYLIEFAAAGKAAGGDRFRLCDTIGVLTPATSKKLIHDIMSNVDIDVEFHAHNDFGLAIANALAACEAAASFTKRKLWVSTTVNGLGERAGNVPIEVFVMNLHKHYGVEKYKTEHILPLCKHVEKASGLQIPLNYPVVGGNMFTHKSGIHVDGVLKNPQLYEVFDSSRAG